MSSLPYLQTLRSPPQILPHWHGKLIAKRVSCPLYGFRLSLECEFHFSSFPLYCADWRERKSMNPLMAIPLEREAGRRKESIYHGTWDEKGIGNVGCGENGNTGSAHLGERIWDVGIACGVGREMGLCPKGHVSFRGWHPGTEQQLTLAIRNCSTDPCHPSSPHFQSLQPPLILAQAELKIKKKEGFNGSHSKIS